MGIRARWQGVRWLAGWPASQPPLLGRRARHSARRSTGGTGGTGPFTYQAISSDGLLCRREVIPCWLLG